jgi:hypothetical protein
MDKISGIIPSSARVSAVDMRDAAPVRSGTPSFGRPDPAGARAAAANGSEVNQAVAQQPGNRQVAGQPQPAAAPQPPPMPAWQAKDNRHASVVSQISDKFFMKNDQPAELPAPRQMELPASSIAAVAAPAVSSRPSGFKAEEIGSFRDLGRSPSMAMETISELGEDEMMRAPVLTQPKGLFPRGSFIDRTV